MSSALLNIRDLHVAYGDIEAVHGISIDVNAGSITTIIGPNGAGKTTTLTAIAGLIPCRGNISFDGRDMQMHSAEDRVDEGMIFVTERRDLFTSMSVADNLLLGGYRLRRQPQSVREAALEQVYETFPRLRERREQLAGTLSGGERQMLALGRALMSRPKLLLLDEPSLGLAPLIVKDIFRIISQLRSANVAVLLIEQNARAALEIADHAYVLERGNISKSGSAKILIEDTNLASTYLGLHKAI